MNGLRKTVIRTGLESLYFSGAAWLMQPFVGGVGVILTLHHVRPARPGAFQPNRLLEITPEFFARMIRRLRHARADLVSLDEVHRRLVERDFRRRFVALTFDDGYRDLLQYAYPILRAQGVPFALYIPTSFPDRLGELWWLALEAVIAKNKRIGLVMDDREERFDCINAAEKNSAYERIYWWLRALPTEDALRDAVRDLCARYGVDMAAFCGELCMNWGEIGEIARDPLVTIGAHTVNHAILGKLDDRAARSEMDMSRSVIAAAVGMRPQHLAYPVGDASAAARREFDIATELGFKTAVTTRPGVIFREHRNHLTALPRISVNGEFQQLRYLSVLMSGAGTAMWNGFRRVEAA